MHFRSLLSLIVIADVFWAPEPLHVTCIVIAFEFAACSSIQMPAVISPEVKKAWPRKGDTVKCQFGAEKSEGVVESSSPSKGTCRVLFSDGVHTVNLKCPEWGVIIKRKKKVRSFTFHQITLLVRPTLLHCV